MLAYLRMFKLSISMHRPLLRLPEETPSQTGTARITKSKKTVPETENHVAERSTTRLRKRGYRYDL
jgi:hypothetical protein